MQEYIENSKLLMIHAIYQVPDGGNVAIIKWRSVFACVATEDEVARAKRGSSIRVPVNNTKEIFSRITCPKCKIKLDQTIVV